MTQEERCVSCMESWKPQAQRCHMDTEEEGSMKEITEKEDSVRQGDTQKHGRARERTL